jgi:HEPN domain-containing protein
VGQEGRPIVVFHAQQAVEKYLKALPAKRQLEFPKTHEIRRLLELLNASDHEVAEALPDGKWLDPFGVDMRYPSDRPETMPGDERRALQLAERTRVAVKKALAR